MLISTSVIWFSERGTASPLLRPACHKSQLYVDGVSTPPPPRCPGLVRRACAVFTLSPGPWLAPNYLRLFSFARVTEKERERVFLLSISGVRCVELVPHHLGPVCAVSPVASPAGPGARMHDEGPMFHLQAHTHPSKNKTG